jgi:hypothetical protein
MFWLNRTKRACLLVVITSLTLVLGCMSASAQAGTVRLTEYSAKFLCGTESSSNPFGLGAAVRPATYATTINIHNPGVIFNGATDPPVVFLKKAVLSSQEGKPLNQPSGFQKDILEADFAEEVDCQVIYSLLHIAPGPFIEGYVVLYALPFANGIPSELDVTDVITATPVTGFGITTEIQTISPRFRQ